MQYNPKDDVALQKAQIMDEINSASKEATELSKELSDEQFAPYQQKINLNRLALQFSTDILQNTPNPHNKPNFNLGDPNYLAELVKSPAKAGEVLWQANKQEANRKSFENNRLLKLLGLAQKDIDLDLAQEKLDKGKEDLAKQANFNQMSYHLENAGRNLSEAFLPDETTREVDYSNWANIKSGLADFAGGFIKGLDQAGTAIAEDLNTLKFAMYSDVDMDEASELAKAITQSQKNQGMSKILQNVGDKLYDYKDSLNAEVAYSGDGLKELGLLGSLKNLGYVGNVLKDNLSASAGEMAGAMMTMGMPVGRAFNAFKAPVGALNKTIGATAGSLGIGTNAYQMATSREREYRHQRGLDTKGLYDVDKIDKNALEKGLPYTLGNLVDFAGIYGGAKLASNGIKKAFSQEVNKQGKHYAKKSIKPNSSKISKMLDGGKRIAKHPISKTAGIGAGAGVTEHFVEEFQTGLELDITNPELSKKERDEIIQKAGLIGGLVGGALGLGGGAVVGTTSAIRDYKNNKTKKAYIEQSLQGIKTKYLDNIDSKKLKSKLSDEEKIELYEELDNLVDYDYDLSKIDEDSVLKEPLNEIIEFRKDPQGTIDKGIDNALDSINNIGSLPKDEQDKKVTEIKNNLNKIATLAIRHPDSFKALMSNESLANFIKDDKNDIYLPDNLRQMKEAFSAVDEIKTDIKNNKVYNEAIDKLSKIEPHSKYFFDKNIQALKEPKINYDGLRAWLDSSKGKSGKDYILDKSLFRSKGIERYLSIKEQAEQQALDRLQKAGIVQGDTNYDKEYEKALSLAYQKLLIDTVVKQKELKQSKKATRNKTLGKIFNKKGELSKDEIGDLFRDDNKIDEDEIIETFKKSTTTKTKTKEKEADKEAKVNFDTTKEVGFEVDSSGNVKKMSTKISDEAKREFFSNEQGLFPANETTPEVNANTLDNLVGYAKEVANYGVSDENILTVGVDNLRKVTGGIINKALHKDTKLSSEEIEFIQEIIKAGLLSKIFEEKIGEQLSQVIEDNKKTKPRQSSTTSKSQATSNYIAGTTIDELITNLQKKFNLSATTNTDDLKAILGVYLSNSLKLSYYLRSIKSNAISSAKVSADLATDITLLVDKLDTLVAARVNGHITSKETLHNFTIIENKINDLIKANDSKQRAFDMLLKASKDIAKNRDKLVNNNMLFILWDKNIANRHKLLTKDELLNFKVIKSINDKTVDTEVINNFNKSTSHSKQIMYLSLNDSSLTEAGVNASFSQILEEDRKIIDIFKEQLNSTGEVLDIEGKKLTSSTAISSNTYETAKKYDPNADLVEWFKIQDEKAKNLIVEVNSLKKDIRSLHQSLKKNKDNFDFDKLRELVKKRDILEPLERELSGISQALRKEKMSNEELSVLLDAVISAHLAVSSRTDFSKKYNEMLDDNKALYPKDNITIRTKKGILNTLSNLYETVKSYLKMFSEFMKRFEKDHKPLYDKFTNDIKLTKSNKENAKKIAKRYAGITRALEDYSSNNYIPLDENLKDLRDPYDSTNSNLVDTSSFKANFKIGQNSREVLFFLSDMISSNNPLGNSEFKELNYEVFSKALDKVDVNINTLIDDDKVLFNDLLDNQKFTNSKAFRTAFYYAFMSVLNDVNTLSEKLSSQTGTLDKSNESRQRTISKSMLSNKMGQAFLDFLGANINEKGMTFSQQSQIKSSLGDFLITVIDSAKEFNTVLKPIDSSKSFNSSYGWKINKDALSKVKAINDKLQELRVIPQKSAFHLVAYNPLTDGYISKVKGEKFGNKLNALDRFVLYKMSVMPFNFNTQTVSNVESLLNDFKGKDENRAINSFRELFVVNYEDSSIQLNSSNDYGSKQIILRDESLDLLLSELEVFLLSKGIDSNRVDTLMNSLTNNDEYIILSVDELRNNSQSAIDIASQDSSTIARKLRDHFEYLEAVDMVKDKTFYLAHEQASNNRIGVVGAKHNPQTNKVIRHAIIGNGDKGVTPDKYIKEYQKELDIDGTKIAFGELKAQLLNSADIADITKLKVEDIVKVLNDTKYLDHLVEIKNNYGNRSIIEQVSEIRKLDKSYKKIEFSTLVSHLNFINGGEFKNGVLTKIDLNKNAIFYTEHDGQSMGASTTNYLSALTKRALQIAKRSNVGVTQDENIEYTTEDNYKYIADLFMLAITGFEENNPVNIKTLLNLPNNTITVKGRDVYNYLNRRLKDRYRSDIGKSALAHNVLSFVFNKEEDLSKDVDVNMSIVEFIKSLNMSNMRKQGKAILMPVNYSALVDTVAGSSIAKMNEKEIIEIIQLFNSKEFKDKGTALQAIIDAVKSNTNGLDKNNIDKLMSNHSALFDALTKKLEVEGKIEHLSGEMGYLDYAVETLIEKVEFLVHGLGITELNELQDIFTKDSETGYSKYDKMLKHFRDKYSDELHQVMHNFNPLSSSYNEYVLTAGNLLSTHIFTSALNIMKKDNPLAYQDIKSQDLISVDDMGSVRLDISNLNIDEFKKAVVKTLKTNPVYEGFLNKEYPIDENSVSTWFSFITLENSQDESSNNDPMYVATTKADKSVNKIRGTKHYAKDIGRALITNIGQTIDARMIKKILRDIPSGLHIFQVYDATIRPMYKYNESLKEFNKALADILSNPNENYAYKIINTINEEWDNLVNNMPDNLRSSVLSSVLKTQTEESIKSSFIGIEILMKIASANKDKTYLNIARGYDHDQTTAFLKYSDTPSKELDDIYKVSENVFTLSELFYRLKKSDQNILNVKGLQSSLNSINTLISSLKNSLNNDKKIIISDEFRDKIDSLQAIKYSSKEEQSYLDFIKALLTNDENVDTIKTLSDIFTSYNAPILEIQNKHIGGALEGKDIETATLDSLVNYFGSVWKVNKDVLKDSYLIRQMVLDITNNQPLSKETTNEQGYGHIVENLDLDKSAYVDFDHYVVAGIPYKEFIERKESEKTTTYKNTVDTFNKEVETIDDTILSPTQKEFLKYIIVDKSLDEKARLSIQDLAGLTKIPNDVFNDLMGNFSQLKRKTINGIKSIDSKIILDKNSDLQEVINLLLADTPYGRLNISDDIFVNLDDDSINSKYKEVVGKDVFSKKPKLSVSRSLNEDIDGINSTLEQEFMIENVGDINTMDNILEEMIKFDLDEKGLQRVRDISEDEVNFIKDRFKEFFNRADKKQFFDNDLKIEIRRVNDDSPMQGSYDSSNNTLRLYMANRSSNMMSASEVYLHELSHSIGDMIENDMSNPKWREDANEMLRMKSIVMAHLRKPEVKTKLAKEMGITPQEFERYFLDYMAPANNLKSIKEFMAIMNSNYIIAKEISTLKTPQRIKLEAKGVTLLDKILNTIGKVIDTVFGTDLTVLSANEYAKFTRLYARLAHARANYLYDYRNSKVKNSINKFLDKLDKTLSPVARRLSKSRNDFIMNKMERLHKLVKEGKKINKAYAYWLAGQAMFFPGTTKGDYHLKVGTFLRDVCGAEVGGIVDQLLFQISPMDNGKRLYTTEKAIADRLDKDSNLFRQTIEEDMKRAFTKITLDEKQEKAVTNVLKKSDIISLSDTLSYDEMIEFLKNPSKVSMEISKVTNELKALSGNNSVLEKFWFDKSKTLAKYMITGKMDGYLLTNAINIALGLTSRTDKNIVRLDVGKTSTAISLIDKLVSLYALKEVNRADIEAVLDIHTQDSDGLRFTYEQIRNITQNSKNAFEVKIEDDKILPSNYVKGYTSIPQNSAVSLKLGTIEDKAQMAKEGYEVLETYAPVHLNRYVVYKSTTELPNLYTRGVFRLTSTGTSGFTLSSIIKSEHPNITDNELRALVSTKISNLNDRLDHKKSSDWVKNNLIPIFNTKGRVIDYKVHITDTVKNDLGIKDISIFETVANEASRLAGKEVALSQAKDTIRALNRYYEANKNNPDIKWIKIDYTLMSQGNNSSIDDDIVEFWNLLPHETKSEIQGENGAGALYVRSDMVTTIIGHRDFRLTNSKRFDAKVTNKAVKRVYRLFEDIVLKSGAVNRENIVIRNPRVVTDNIKSNFFVLALYGIFPDDFIRDAVRCVKEVDDYNRHMAEITKIRYRLDHLSKNDPRYNSKKAYLERNLKQYEAGIEDSLIKQFDDWGLVSNIAEDIDLKDSKNNDYFDAIYEQYRKRMSRRTREMFDQMLISNRTGMYSFLSKLTQMSDLTARYSLYKRLKEQGKSDTQIRDILQRSFINYSTHDHKYVKYMNDSGFMYFTKYLTRSQAMVNSDMLTEHLGRTALFHLLGNIFKINVVSPLGSWLPLSARNLEYRIGTPPISTIDNMLNDVIHLDDFTVGNVL